MGKIMGNIVGLPSPRSDWNQTDETKADYIKNKPEKEIQAMKSLQHYGDANIVPSDASLFDFNWIQGAPADGVVQFGFGIRAKSTDISGDIVIPCEAVDTIGRVMQLMSINQFAFTNCINITSIIIPDGNDILIRGYAFAGCIGLTNVTISKSVTEIAGSAFSGCTSLTDVYFRGTKAQWDAIIIAEGNEALLNATIHYEYTDITKEYVDEKIAEVKPTIVEEELDVTEATITMEDNHIFHFAMVMNKLEVTLPKMKVGYASVLYFATPGYINADYSTFPKNVRFKGDSTEDGRFVPEADKIYTIVFDYCGYIVGYVSGVNLYGV
jgi:hypothetical protein